MKRHERKRIAEGITQPDLFSPVGDDPIIYFCQECGEVRATHIGSCSWGCTFSTRLPAGFVSLSDWVTATEAASR